MATSTDLDRSRTGPERANDFTTLSGVPVNTLYTPADLPPNFDFNRDVGAPGAAPYVRGIHATGYRGKLWTMRQFSGFATPEETNERYRFLLSQGQTGLSVAFDLPTLMGYDSDDVMSAGEVGKCGVAIDSVEDMERLFQGICLDQVTTSMTINSPAAVIWAMFLVAAERQGAEWKRISGTLQNDILKEYIAQKEYIFPPAPSMRLVVDTIEFGARETPRFNPVSISGYHIREAGSTALQELAFTLRDGMEYVEWCLRRGMAVDDFAPRLSFFFNAHSDFFEEIGKYRAARKLWHQVMTERYGARNPRSAALRFHTQTAGVSLTAQQPYNNLTRVALQALSAVLGGTQSLHTNSLDEALALPTAEAATLALRTQQIIAHETGVTNTVDPLGGSFFVEKTTLDMEQGALEYFRRIDAMGGMVGAIEQGFPQREIADASYRYQQAFERGEKIMVGVNDFITEEAPLPTLYIDETAREQQIAKLKQVRARRSQAAADAGLARLRAAAQGTENTMPALLDCVRASCTVGEICNTLRDVFGAYTETAIT
ncbi:MAG TPA: methylmalonyl-CoA mutase family protein [Terriglobales bacterium]|nr:methylmalonyl-CoA mutase family protein [Terriglobales bacterium]